MMVMIFEIKWNYDNDNDKEIIYLRLYMVMVRVYQKYFFHTEAGGTFFCLVLFLFPIIWGWMTDDVSAGGSKQAWIMVNFRIADFSRADPDSFPFLDPEPFSRFLNPDVNRITVA